MTSETGGANAPGAQQDLLTENRAAYIPLGFYIDFLSFLDAHRDSIEIITYDDLEWGEARDPATCYDEEWKRWRQALKQGRRSPRKIHVLLQHDVDSAPERTMNMLRWEDKYGIPSVSMIFNRRVNRRLLQHRDRLETTDYPLDIALMRDLESRRFQIGYHCNAFELAHFDEARAIDIMRADIDALSQHFDVRIMSAHGGAPGPDGRNNRDLPFPADLAQRVHWVHNGHTPVFDGTYSDGGINSPKRDPAKRDLRDFVRSWRPGGRYRILTHPQYYNDPCSTSPRLAEAAWYKEVKDTYERANPGNAWAGVSLDSTSPSLPARSAQQGADLLRRVRARAAKWLGRGR
ncbi:MAG: hypothetical protein Kow00114_01410 [Kiloniellaceae bacterium]